MRAGRSAVRGALEIDVAGLLMSLRRAQVAVGQATLAVRAERPEEARIHLAEAQRALVRLERCVPAPYAT